MALLNDSIGHIIEIPDSTQQPLIFTMGNLKKQVARVINAENDNEILDVAGFGIRWAITYAELTRSFKFGRADTTSAALVLNGNTITLPSNFFGVRSVNFAYTANSISGDLQAGDHAGTIPYEPWSQFIKRGTEYGDVPIVWSAKNTFTDGTISYWPKSTQKMVDNWTVKVTHDTPIGLPDSDTDVLAAPRDLALVLIEGAKYYVLFERKSDDQIRYRHQFRVFEEMIARYGAHENKRHGRKHAAWTIGEPN